MKERRIRGESTSPWLAIPLSDYESHMAMPVVAQAQLLADVFESLLTKYRPDSVAVIGCAGGNGFDRIHPGLTTRVVGVDINPDYIEAARRRYAHKITDLELITADIQGGDVRVAPVYFVYAALLFEYVDARRTLECLRHLIRPDGILATVVQVAGTGMVTPTPFRSLESLAAGMETIDAGALAALALARGFREVGRDRKRSQGGKDFDVQVFAREAP